MVKNLPANVGDTGDLGSIPDPWVGMIPWRRRKWQCTPVFLPVKPHRQRSLAGHSPWALKESDATEHRQTQVTFSASLTPSLLYVYCL